MIFSLVQVKKHRQVGFSASSKHISLASSDVLCLQFMEHKHGPHSFIGCPPVHVIKTPQKSVKNCDLYSKQSKVVYVQSIKTSHYP